MKRRIFTLIIIAASVTLNVSAQSAYLGFSLGTSIPRGDFAANDDLFTSGYAIPGFTVRFEGYYFPLPVIGLGGTLTFGSLYAGNDDYLEDLIEYAYSQTEIPMFGDKPTVDEVGLDSGFWNYVNLMAGPELSVPFGPFQAALRGQAGLTFGFYPKREFLYTEDLNKLDIMARGSSVALAYSYGGSLLYKGRSGTGIKLSADYLSSQASYDLEMNVLNNSVEYNMLTPAEVDIEALSITLGFFYVF